ncbi:MAG: Glu-tRNA(Gln) amidotransferase subunit GatD [Thermoplasmata archaeon]|nr:MAG: Glu-tRNA(Gln) amidotransferase subunit GatD [Thermoplasmata archaeon]
MTYSDNILKRFKEAGIQMGDTLEIISSEGTFQGVLMPHHEFSAENIVTIKLDNGYNIGVEMDDKTELRMLQKAARSHAEKRTIAHEDSKPILAVIGTGGTIASYVDYRTGAVHPALTAEELAYSVPELAEMCNIKAKVLYSIFSEDMTVKHWQELAREVARELNSGARGVIVPHGTDAMGYTSAALSFMLRGLTGPVVFTGAQRSSDRPSSDANLNLISAAHLAIHSDLGEVVVMMHGETSDSFVSIHRGTRVRKMHTSRRDAFQSLNQGPLGIIDKGEIELSEAYQKRGPGPVELHDSMEERACLLYSHPHVTAEHFDFLAENNLGIVIAGTGLGHIPQYLLESVNSAVKSGIFVIMTSQCLSGSVNMNVYSRGRDLLGAGVISGKDMLPETALVKLMWVLGQTQEPEEVKALMEKNLVGEITMRRGL